MPDALLLLPGLLNYAALWSHQIDGVADLVDDIRVPDLTRHETVREIAAAILAEAPSRFALAGLSMGGYVALELLRQAPERVERLALLDTSARADRSEEHTSELQSLMRISYAVFCLNKKKKEYYTTT